MTPADFRVLGSRGQTVRVDPQLWRTFKELSTAQLAGDEDSELSLADVGLEGVEGREKLAFHTYSQKGLSEALRRYGTVERLEKKGVGPVELELSLADPYRPHIVVWNRTVGVPVIDVTVSLGLGARFGLPRPFADARMLVLESLTLQHPTRTFDWERPPLPGQKAPGISMSKEIVELLLLMARRVGVVGMALTPASFHAAYVYSPHFLFVKPVVQGHFDVLCRQARAMPLWMMAWGLELGCVRTRHHRRASFTGDSMVAPLTRELAMRFAAARYADKRKQALRTVFKLDKRCLLQKLPWDELPKSPMPESLRLLLGA